MVVRLFLLAGVLLSVSIVNAQQLIAIEGYRDIGVGTDDFSPYLPYKPVFPGAPGYPFGPGGGQYGPDDGPINPIVEKHFGRSYKDRRELDKRMKALATKTTCPKTVDKARKRLRQDGNNRLGDAGGLVDLISNAQMPVYFTAAEVNACRLEYQAYLLKQLNAMPKKYYDLYEEAFYSRKLAEVKMPEYAAIECLTPEIAKEASTVWQKQFNTAAHLEQQTREMLKMYELLHSTDVKPEKKRTADEKATWRDSMFDGTWREKSIALHKERHLNEVVFPELTYSGEVGAVTVRQMTEGDGAADWLDTSLSVQIEFVEEVPLEPKEVTGASVDFFYPRDKPLSAEYSVVAGVDMPGLKGPKALEPLYINEYLRGEEDRINQTITFPPGYKFCKYRMTATRNGSPIEVPVKVTDQQFSFLIDHGGLWTFDADVHGRVQVIEKGATACEFDFNGCESINYDHITPFLAKVKERKPPGLLDSITVYRYGGPESALQSSPPYFKFKQHALYLDMYGPADTRVEQIREIKDACLAGALAAQAGVSYATYGLDLLASLLTDGLPVLEETFRTCIEVQNGLGGFVGVLIDKDVLYVEVRERHWWSN